MLKFTKKTAAPLAGAFFLTFILFVTFMKIAEGDASRFHNSLFGLLLTIPVFLSILVVWHFFKPTFQEAKTPLKFMCAGIGGGFLVVIMVSLFAGLSYLASSFFMGQFFQLGVALYLLFLFLVGGLFWGSLPAIVLGAALGLWLHCKRGCLTGVEV